ncbi:hypothetical protein ACFL5B_03840, partial [Candidatus Latescibacterota bacterium]
MEIYWSLKSIPELAELSTKERALVWSKAYRKILCHWEILVAFPLCCLIIPIFFIPGFLLTLPLDNGIW